MHFSCEECIFFCAGICIIRIFLYLCPRNLYAIEYGYEAISLFPDRSIVVGRVFKAIEVQLSDRQASACRDRGGG